MRSERVETFPELVVERNLDIDLGSEGSEGRERSDLVSHTRFDGLHVRARRERSVEHGADSATGVGELGKSRRRAHEPCEHERVSAPKRQRILRKRRLHVQRRGREERRVIDDLREQREPGVVRRLHGQGSSQRCAQADCAPVR